MRRLTLVLVAAALALSACSGSDSSTPRTASSPPSGSATPSSAAPQPRPDPPPAAHGCYRLAYEQALAPTMGGRQVLCTEPHSAVTYYVGHYPKGLPVDGPRVHALQKRVCPRRFAAYVGGTTDTRRISLLRPVWFTATLDQAELGAHWFQCVAIALRGDQQLARLDAPVKGALDRDAGRSHYGLCATDQPGTSDFEQRLCSLPHSWRALRSVGFPAGRYPGVDRVKGAGQTPCQDAARAVADDPLNYQWSYTWPTREQWRSGQIWGVCWAPA